MPRKQRDYHAEYEARKQAAARRGESLYVATGHARVDKGEVPRSVTRALERGKASRVFRDMKGSDRESVASKLRDRTGKSLHEIWSQLLGSP